MAIEKTYLLGKNITLGCGFDLQAKAPLDSRQVVPEYDGLQALIDGNAAYEGMIVYDEGTKKTYQAQLVDGVLAFREFGINEAELKALIASETTAAMEFKGAATALPENPSKGDFYKVTAEFEVTEGETAKVGDSIVYDGEQWFLIPSGDDIEDTWRPVTDVDNDASLTFAAGDKLDVAVASNGTITYSHEAIDAPTATPVAENEQTRTYITAVETDGYGHITGYKTATENVEDTNTTYEFEGLPVGEGEEAPSSVYFQVKSSDEEAAEVIYLDAYSKNEADAAFKAKRAEKLDAVATDANVFVDTVAQDVDGNITITTKAVDFSAVNGRLDDLEAVDHTHTFVDTDVDDAIAKKHSHTFVESELNLIAKGDVAKWNTAAEKADYNDQGLTELTAYVGTIPTDEKYADITNVISYVNKKAEETLAAASGNSTETAASVKQQLDNYKSENNQAVKFLEQEIGVAKQDIAAAYQDFRENIYLKVDKVEGKDLISTAEIERLANVDNYDDEEIRGLINAIDNHSHENKDVLDGITAAKVEAWNDAYDHSQVAHAPADAQANVIEAVKVNGTALEIKDKAVDIAIPTGALASKSEVGKRDLDQDLAVELDEKMTEAEVDARIDALVAAVKDPKDNTNQVAASLDALVKLVWNNQYDVSMKANAHEVYTKEQTFTKDEVNDAIATAKTEASNQDAVVLAEAQKYADQAKADAIADAAGKVNTLAGNVYTKTEVDALLSAAHTWGEF